MIGRTIGHYEIIEKIGEGGMGAVYKARDIHLDRSVALKMLPGESVANPERKRRFALEAKAASALNHPNIITIYDIDVADGVDFIAMEYVAGPTLADMIPPEGMEPARAIQLGTQIADALATAHHSGIVHRDLKPSNIMLNAQGRVKVLDFGLARQQSRDLRQASQKPYFRWLGTPEKDKRHVLYDAAHDVMVNRTEVVKEVLSWLDQYLGPIAR